MSVAILMAEKYNPWAPPERPGEKAIIKVYDLEALTLEQVLEDRQKIEKRESRKTKEKRKFIPQTFFLFEHDVIKEM